MTKHFQCFFLQPLAFKADDWVRIIDDVDVLARLQVRHGDWTPAMKEVAGKVGRVVKVYTDGDVRVKVGSNTWTFSPASLRITQAPATQVNNANVNGGADADRHQALNQVQRGPEVSEMSSGVVRLNLEEIVTDAALGNFEGVRNRLSSTPPPAWKKISQNLNLIRLALHVAARKGHLEVVRVLVEHFPDQVTQLCERKAPAVHVAVGAGQGEEHSSIGLLLEPGIGEINPSRSR